MGEGASGMLAAVSLLAGRTAGFVRTWELIGLILRGLPDLKARSIDYTRRNIVLWGERMLITFLVTSPLAIAALFGFAKFVDPLTGQFKR